MQTVPVPRSTRVVRDPAILHGEPTVGGWRTSVRSVVLAAREWGGVDGVLYAYPHLSAEDVADALAFYLEHQAEIDASIARNSDN